MGCNLLMIMMTIMMVEGEEEREEQVRLLQVMEGKENDPSPCKRKGKYK